jgi:hypothetical protein
VLTEQRPRMQSRAEVVPLGQGDAVVFAVNKYRYTNYGEFLSFRSYSSRSQVVGGLGRIDI